MPDTGKIQVYRTGSGAGIRLDGGNGCAGFSITPHYDSLLVKTISWDRTFEKAINKTIRSIKELRVRGVKTNVGFLINVLQDPMFRAGKCSTKFIDEHPELFNIRESKNTDQFLIRTNKAEYYKELPFTLHLEKFVLTNYPGSNTPSSYQSYLIIEDKHSQKKQQELLEMNKIIDYQGYRLFQSSYDDDEKGTIISVSKDTLGRKVTYTGYSILLIGFLLFFFHKHSKFRSLIRLLKHKTKHITPLLLFVFCVNLTTQSTYGNTQKTIEIQKSATLKEHLDYFAALPMLSNDGRMMPIQTFASEVTRKLFKSTSVEGVSPVQFLLEVTLFPDLWMHKKLFTIESKALAQEFAKKGGLH